MLRPPSRAQGPCPLTKLPPLIVYAPCPVPGHLDQAAFNVMGFPFVAHQVGHIVVVDGVEHSGQCAIKCDSVADLVATGAGVTPAVLAGRSADMAGALRDEAVELLAFLGPAPRRVSLLQEELREYALDRTEWQDADVGYAPRLNMPPFAVGVEHDDPAVVGSEKSDTHGAHDAGSKFGCLSIPHSLS